MVIKGVLLTCTDTEGVLRLGKDKLSCFMCKYIYEESNCLQLQYVSICPPEHHSFMLR